MNLKVIEEALLNYLRIMPAPYTVAWPNIDYVPTIGTPYLTPRFLPNRSDYAAVGANSSKRHRGLFQVTVHGAINGGTADAAVADNIGAYYTGKIIAFETARVRIGSFDGSPGLPYRTAAIRDGAWNLTPVTIPWWSDEF